MSLLYDQFDEEVKRLIRQGASMEEVSKRLLREYPQLVSQAAQVLKHIQAVERDLRKSGR